MNIPVVRVLLVEDNLPDADLFQEYMEQTAQIRIEITHATSLVEASEHYRNVDVIILDMGLPDSQGMETIITVVENTPNTPVIVLTGNDDFNLGLQAVKNGAQDFLSKGQLNTVTLEKAIQHAIERKKQIVELGEMKAKQHQLATHDSLTALTNRLGLMTKLEDVILHAKRSKEKFSLMFMDLDRFKLINDTVGHSAGDEVLKVVAQRLKALLRESDIIARMGGDEFVCVLRDVSDSLGIKKIAANILQHLQMPIVLNGVEHFIGASIGIAFYPQDGVNAIDLLKSADQAMYSAKEQGRNQFKFAYPNLNQKMQHNFTFEEELQSALNNDEFVILNQPVFEADGITLAGFEALLRWEHPSNGLLLPEEFQSKVMTPNLNIQIGEFALQEVANILKTLESDKYAHLRFTMKISFIQISQECFVERLLAIFELAGVSVTNLVLEISENVLLRNVPIVFNNVQKLNQAGVGVCIGDFATGYASLKCLSEYPFSALKVNSEFILDASRTDKNRMLSGAIVALAQKIGLKVIAEGVETKEQVSMLKDMDCNQMQGDYYSEPLYLESFTKYLHSYDRNVRSIANLDTLQFVI